MRKKLLFVLLFIFTIFPIISEAKDIDLIINGQKINSKLKPTIQQDFLYVPLNNVQKPLKLTTSLSKDKNVLTIQHKRNGENNKYVYNFKTKKITLNDKVIDFGDKQNIRFINKNIYIPISFIRGRIGIDVEYDHKKKIVEIDTSITNDTPDLLAQMDSFSNVENMELLETTTKNKRKYASGIQDLIIYHGSLSLDILDVVVDGMQYDLYNWDRSDVKKYQKRLADISAKAILEQQKIKDSINLIKNSPDLIGIKQEVIYKLQQDYDLCMDFIYDYPNLYVFDFSNSDSYIEKYFNNSDIYDNIINNAIDYNFF